MFTGLTQAVRLSDRLSDRLSGNYAWFPRGVADVANFRVLTSYAC